MPNSVPRKTYDFLLIGGGVMGLSLAWELAQQGAKTCLVDSGQFGQEASWAAAGMIPPGPAEENCSSHSSMERLAALSQKMHRQWHERLLELTGIHNGYRQSGAIYLRCNASDASTSGAANSQGFSDRLHEWQRLGIAHHRLDSEALSDLEPHLSNVATKSPEIYHLPEEAQIRPPRHLHALTAACQRAGVELMPKTLVQGFRTEESHVSSVRTSSGNISANQVCLTSGCWTGQLAEQLGITLPIKPIRGQIVLLKGLPGQINRIVNVGSQYLTPRVDGRVLVGSTEEDVGFSKGNTATGINTLLEFALSLSPALADCSVEKCWSGLRPSTANGAPYLGQLPEFSNAWIVAGHFRSGIQLSPATATVMRALLLGQETPFDFSELNVMS